MIFQVGWGSHPEFGDWGISTRGLEEYILPLMNRLMTVEARQVRLIIALTPWTEFECVYVLIIFPTMLRLQMKMEVSRNSTPCDDGGVSLGREA